MGKVLKFMRPLIYWPLRAMGKLATALFIVYFSQAAAQADRITVAALGDSLTQGYGLMPDVGFVPQLQKWLATQGEKVIVMNAGVSGDTTAGGLSRVEWTLTPDVKAMIVALGGNDLLRGIDPASSRANLKGILEVAAQHELPVLLIGVPAPGNYGADFKRDFDAMYPTLAQEFDTLLYPNFLAVLAREDAPLSPDPKYFQADGIHPNAKGVVKIVNDLGPKVQALITRIKADPS